MCFFYVYISSSHKVVGFSNHQWFAISYWGCVTLFFYDSHNRYKIYKNAVINKNAVILPQAPLRSWVFAEASIGLFESMYYVLSNALYQSANQVPWPEIFAVVLLFF